ncbi:MAG: DUF177 domain-containing protein [Bacilli bacterium]|nr:DUF177 domain-containing protein [Bacilli bacterium]
MKWSLQQLQKLYKPSNIFEIEYNFDDYLDELKNSGSETDILEVQTAKAIVSIVKLDMETFKFDYHITANLLIACALTLEPVPYSLDFQVSETYSTDLSEEDDEIFPIEGNTIDTKAIVWSNILLNIPIRVVRDDAYEILKKRNIVLDEDIPEED